MKKPLILLHGALGTLEQLEALSHSLKNDFDVYSFDFEGHGSRPSDKSFSMDLFIENTLQYMSDHQLESSSFFGYSMGGYVALKLAKNHPEKVEKIFTYGTKFNWTPESAAQEVKMLNPEKILEKVPTFANHLEKLHSPTDWKQMMHKTAQMMLELGNGKHMSEKEFASITHPVKLAIGTNDHMVTIDETRSIANILPCGELLLLENWAHPIEKLDLQKIRTELLDFIV
jgi:esterase/lipase